MPYKIENGDVIETKKQHPCGSKKFEITRTGMDFRMKCFGCQKEIWVKREKLEKRIKNVFRNGSLVDKADLLNNPPDIQK